MDLFWSYEKTNPTFSGKEPSVRSSEYPPLSLKLEENTICTMPAKKLTTLQQSSTQSQKLASSTKSTV